MLWRQGKNITNDAYQYAGMLNKNIATNATMLVTFVKIWQ
jgi:hypothetical protein